jgi:hypothetical protein
MRVAALLIALCATASADSPDGGTGVSVQVTENGDTTVSVTHGELAVKAGGEETHVKRGERVRVKKGERAKLVLTPPEQAEPADGARLSTLGVALKWKPVDGARGYRVTVASDAQCNAVVWASARTDGAKTRADLKNPGTYFWRVVPVGPRDLEGPPSAVRSFTVDAPPPPLKAGKPSWK